jgi:hypothetical protein
LYEGSGTAGGRWVLKLRFEKQVWKIFYSHQIQKINTCIDIIKLLWMDESEEDLED